MTASRTKQKQTVVIILERLLLHRFHPLLLIRTDHFYCTEEKQEFIVWSEFSMIMIESNRQRRPSRWLFWSFQKLWSFVMENETFLNFTHCTAPFSSLLTVTLKFIYWPIQLVGLRIKSLRYPVSFSYCFSSLIYPFIWHRTFIYNLFKTLIICSSTIAACATIIFPSRFWVMNLDLGFRRRNRLIVIANSLR